MLVQLRTLRHYLVKLLLTAIKEDRLQRVQLKCELKALQECTDLGDNVCSDTHTLPSYFHGQPRPLVHHGANDTSKNQQK